MNEYKCYLSPSEAQMVHYYDLGAFLVWDDSVMMYHLRPKLSIYELYEIMVERAFLANKNSVWDEALRTIVQGMTTCTLDRGTPEFEAVFDKINRI